MCWIFVFTINRGTENKGIHILKWILICTVRKTSKTRYCNIKLKMALSSKYEIFHAPNITNKLL